MRRSSGRLRRRSSRASSRAIRCARVRLPGTVHSAADRIQRPTPARKPVSGRIVAKVSRVAACDRRAATRYTSPSLTGCSAAWLARLTGGQKVGSSNLPSPIPDTARPPTAWRRRFCGGRPRNARRQWHASEIGRSLSVNYQTAAAYAGFLEGCFLIRRLPSFHANLSKRLVKAPKLVMRDSGLLHAMLGISSMDALLAHPAVGASGGRSR